jgi:hypothetical protein
MNQEFKSYNEVTHECAEVTPINSFSDRLNNRYVTNYMCTVPLTVLEASPYMIRDGEEIFARVQCRNKLGMSDVSEVNNGAINPSIPDRVL